MDYILFNSDGSINETHLNQYVQQGENSKKIEISIDGIDDDTDLVAQAFCTLPNKQTTTLAGTWSAELAGLGEAGWTFSITDSVTHYNGIVLVAIRVRNTDTGLTLVTYPFALVINQTGVQPEADSGVTLEELDGYLKLVLSWINNSNLENGEGENSLQQKGGCVAGYDHQFVVGKFNNNKSTNLFEVGNGMGEGGIIPNSNAFEVREDGTAAVGMYPSQPNDVATKGYADYQSVLYKHTISFTGSSYYMVIINKSGNSIANQTALVNAVDSAIEVYVTTIILNGGARYPFIYHEVGVYHFLLSDSGMNEIYGSTIASDNITNI